MVAVIQLYVLFKSPKHTLQGFTFTVENLDLKQVIKKIYEQMLLFAEIIYLA